MFKKGYQLEVLKETSPSMEGIEIESNVHLQCIACPTIYEFYDIDGNYYYFRYRHGIMSLNKNKETIWNYEYPKELDGLCSWYEFCFNLFTDKNTVILDYNSNIEPWLGL